MLFLHLPCSFLSSFESTSLSPSFSFCLSSSLFLILFFLFLFSFLLIIIHPYSFFSYYYYSFLFFLFLFSSFFFILLHLFLSLFSLLLLSPRFLPFPPPLYSASSYSHSSSRQFFPSPTQLFLDFAEAVSTLLSRSDITLVAFTWRDFISHKFAGNFFIFTSLYECSCS